MIPHIGLAIVTFLITNIDDLLILSVYFASPAYTRRNIVIGQFAGIITLILLSLAGMLIGNLVEDRWISLLGLLPIGLGIKDLLSKDESDDDDVSKSKTHFQFLNIALVTIANGGDNIGVYVPLFANLERVEVSLYVVVFLAMTAVLCVIAYYFVNHPRVKKIFEKYGKIILPYFLILLGLFILKDFILSLV